MTDGEAVLDDVLTVLDGLDSHLVALGDVLQSGHGKAVHFHQRALGNGMQGNDHVVDGADMNCLRHSYSPYGIAQKGMNPLRHRCAMPPLPKGEVFALKTLRFRKSSPLGGAGREAD